MRRVTSVRIIGYFLLITVYSHEASAKLRSIDLFPYSKICTKEGVVDAGKLIALAIKLSDVDGSTIFQKLIPSEIIEARNRAATDNLITFRRYILREQDEHYKVYFGEKKVKTFDVVELLKNPKSYNILCSAYNENPSPGEQARKDATKAFENIGKSLILRQDTDNFSKTLKEDAKPAAFSITHDGIKKNTIVQNKFALGAPITSNLDDGNILIALLPYVRQDGTFNSSDKLKDVDIVALGTQADIYPVDLTTWLSGKMSIRGEYLTDTENEKEAFASEFTFTPVATQESKWIIPLNERIDASVLGGEGASFQIDLTGRLRYGFVQENGDVETLLAGSEYMRIGLSTGANFKMGGDDIFSGVGVYVKYWYFSDALDSSLINEFYKLDAGITYDLDKYYGIKISYETGRHEDTLQEIDKALASFTVRFGDVKAPGEGEEAD